MASGKLDNRGRRGELTSYQGRYLWLMAGCGIAFCLLLGRLWYLQVIHGETYWRASTENIIRNVETSPARGRIYDRNHTVLAENRPSYDVYLIPHIFAGSGDDEVFGLLQDYLRLSDDQVEKLRRASKTKAAEVLVTRDATRAQVALVESDRLRLPGVEVRANSHRHYPLHTVGAHAIGFVGEIRRDELERLEPFGYRQGDYYGRMGLEQAYEQVLRGSPGIERQVVDARGLPQGEAQTRFLIGEYQRVKPVPGRDLVTTLDAELMLLIEQAMRDYPSGAAVAVDPRDGSVLALYSKPSFNPNSWSGRLSPQEKLRSDNDPFKPMLDKTVNGYFPGSTFKIVGSVAALENNLMSVSDETYCPGHYKFGGRRFRCWKRGGHGNVNVHEALQQSCDVYYYRVADMMGLDPISKYAYMFGFGERTGLGLNNESAGRVPTKQWHEDHSPDGYQRGFDLNTVLGQGDTLVTPVQLAISYAAVANGGTIWYPRVVDEIRNHDGETLFTFEPRARKKVDISQEALEAVRHGLWMASNEDGGTSYRHRPDSVVVAGKTGTAQVHRIGAFRIANRDKDWRLRDHAWFGSYAPYEEPEIALVVFLQHGGHGGSDAAPVAMKILGRWFEQRDGTTLERKLGTKAPSAEEGDDG